MTTPKITVLPASERLVYCRRRQDHVPAHRHTECPHCFGTVEEVVTGSPGEFCDWRAGFDPVHAGAPAGNDFDCEE